MSAALDFVENALDSQRLTLNPIQLPSRRSSDLELTSGHGRPSLDGPLSDFPP